MKFKVIDNDNKEIECNMLFTFRDDSNDIDYIVYTDGTKDSSGELEIYSARYVMEGSSYVLKAIENDYEWNLIDNMLASKYKEIGD